MDCAAPPNEQLLLVCRDGGSIEQVRELIEQQGARNLHQALVVASCFRQYELANVLVQLGAEFN